MTERSKHIVIDENLHARLKLLAVQERKNLSDFTEEILMKGLKVKGE